MEALPDRLDGLFPVLLELVLDNLHLYALTAAYWVTIAAFLGLRYLAGRRAASDRLRVVILVLGLLAVVVAAIDVVVRGQAGITHVSLVAYLATPIGIGRYLVARWDGHEPSPAAALRMRQLTYLVGFLAFVALSALDGDPWFFTRPTIDRSSAEAIIEQTAWMPFMATVLGLLLVLDTISSWLTIAWNRVRGTNVRQITGSRPG